MGDLLFEGPKAQAKMVCIRLRLWIGDGRAIGEDNQKVKNKIRTNGALTLEDLGGAHFDKNAATQKIVAAGTTIFRPEAVKPSSNDTTGKPVE